MGYILLAENRKRIILQKKLKLTIILDKFRTIHVVFIELFIISVQAILFANKSGYSFVIWKWNLL